MLKAKRNKDVIMYQFGVRLPRTSKGALDLDASQVTTYWSDSTEKRKNLIYDEYNRFKEK